MNKQRREPRERERTYREMHLVVDCIPVVCDVKQSVTATSLSVIIDSQMCASKSSKKKTAIIVGVAVGVAVLLVAAAIVLLLLFRKQLPFFKHRAPRSRKRSDYMDRM